MHLMVDRCDCSESMARFSHCRASACLLLTLLLATISTSWADDSGMCTTKPPEGENCGSESSNDASALPPDSFEFSEEMKKQIAEEMGLGDAVGIQMGMSAIKRPNPADFVGAPLPPPFVLDITATVQRGMPVWESEKGVGCFARVLHKDMDKGDASYQSYIGINAHTGTHIDMPSHFLPEEYKAGNTVEKVDLNLLMGPVLVVEVPEGQNITADTLESMLLPENVERIIFKTDSTTKGLMYETPFHSSYTAMTPSGARWLLEKRPSVKTIGIDYLSIATYNTCAKTHVALFKKKMMVIEGLVLEDVPPGYYTLTCLPLKIEGAEGAPARCILTNAPAEYFYAQMAYEQEQKQLVDEVLAHDAMEIAALSQPDEYEDV